MRVTLNSNVKCDLEITIPYQLNIGLWNQGIFEPRGGQDLIGWVSGNGLAPSDIPPDTKNTTWGP